MDGKKIRFFCHQTFQSLALCFVLFMLSPKAHSAVIEISAMGAYSKSNYADGYASSTRRYTGSIDFKFTQVSALQFEYMTSVSKASYLTNVGTRLPYYTREAITAEDRVYSFNWVQNLVPQKWIIQPYVVFGGGKMKRTYTKEYPEFGVKETFTQNVTSGVGGVGLRIFLTKNWALKGEFKTYVPSFRFSKWKENQMFSAGVSWLF